jgi:hypothetical protein
MYVKSTTEAAANQIEQQIVVIEALYSWAMVLFKLSLVLFFWKFVTKKWQRKVLVVLIILNFIVGDMHFFLSVFQCGLPDVKYTIFVKKVTGQCISMSLAFGLGYPHGIVNALSDVVLVAMPIRTVWQSKITRKDKWLVSFIFAIGCA